MKKNVFLLGGVLVLTVLVGMLGFRSFFQANILERLDGLEKSAVELFRTERPEVSRFRGFNRFFRSEKNDEDLLKRYRSLVVSYRDLEGHPYLKEILTFLHLLESQSRKFREQNLPMYPDDNMMTFGLAAAIHFESDRSFEVAQEGGYIPQDVKQGTFMSRMEYLKLVASLYFPEIKRNIVRKLLDKGVGLGFDLPEETTLKDQKKWASQQREGFLLVEGLRVSMQAVKVLARVQRQAFRAEYNESVVELPLDKQVEFSEDSVRMLARVFREEAGANNLKDLSQELVDEYREVFDVRISSSLVQDMRRRFYKKLGRRAPEAAVLPAFLDLGECGVAMSEKLNLGSYVEIGPKGALLACATEMGSWAVEFPPNAVLLNGGVLPEASAVVKNEEYEGYAFKLDFGRMLQNTFLLDKDGEQKLRLLGIKDSAEDLKKDQFGLFIANDEEKFGPYISPYDEFNGVEYLLPVRIFKDDVLKVYVEYKNR